MITLVCAALAAYRLGRMIAYESGPMRAFERLRGLVFDRYGHTWIDDGINCPLCVSFWLALVLYWLPLWVIAPLAAAGIAAFLLRMTER